MCSVRSLVFQIPGRSYELTGNMATKDADPSELPLFWHYRVEKGSGYRAGGYPPIHLGDVFVDRYEVIHKLGHGGFATVWLARDRLEHRYVALKMCKSSESTAASSERDILWLIQQQDSSHSGRLHISYLLDSFTIESPNGSHECLVFPFRGPSIRSIYEGNQQLFLWANHARRLGQQLLSAVAYSHSLNVVHADITPKNLLLGLSDAVHQYSTEQLLGLIGQPELITVEAFDNGRMPPSYPRYIVEPADLLSLTKAIVVDIYLTDFGDAFHDTHSPVRNSLGGIPFAYKAPEMLFERHQSAASDIWAAACCLHYMRFGCQPMEDMFGPDGLVLNMIEYLGNIPDQWSALYLDRFTVAKPRSEYLANKAQKRVIGVGHRPHLPVEPETPEPWPTSSKEGELSTKMKVRFDLVRSLKQIPGARQGYRECLGTRWLVHITPEEAQSSTDLSSRMLAWQPSQRSSAQQLLNHEWFAPARFVQTDVRRYRSHPFLQFWRSPRSK